MKNLQTHNPNKQSAGVSVTQIQQRLTISPFKHLPPPDQCEHYERIIPGFSDRILTMAETQLRLQEKKLDQDHKEKIGEQDQLISAFRMNSVLAVVAHTLFTSFAAFVTMYGGSENLIIGVGVILVQMIYYFLPEVKRFREGFPKEEVKKP